MSGLPYSGPHELPVDPHIPTVLLSAVLEALA